MRNKKLLVIILLSLSFCFVSGAGYGEVKEWMYKTEASLMDLRLLEAKVNYMMTNPANFLNVSFYYDSTGTLPSGEFPKPIDTKGKIYVMIYDNRGRFSYHKSGIGLLDSFKKELEIIWSFVKIMIATDMDVDIVATLSSGQRIRLAYFYQGEYHLWGD